MGEIQIGQYEEVIKGEIEGISSVTDDSYGNLIAVTLDGFVYKISNQRHTKKTETGGQAFDVITDNENTLFITDLAQQRIYSYSDEESLQEIVKSYEGKPFLGPNSIAFHENSNSLYFTDSGPMGETSIISPHGSVFMTDIEQGTIKPLIMNSLAHPSGIAVTQDGRTVYVSETYKNRLLKICFFSSGSHYSSVFYQFSGRLGPTALCISDSNLIYIANFEFQSLSSKGKVSVLNSNAELKGFFYVPISEITSMAFSKLKRNQLYITGSGKCYKITVPGE
jgi:sugar lactone lactonase YvrE